eukprot:1138406-Pelagomonas_calceolata.AAC.1
MKGRKGTVWVEGSQGGPKNKEAYLSLRAQICGLLRFKNLDIELSHHHVMEPWSSARRATARRRSPYQILVVGKEKKCPLQWEPMGDSFLNASSCMASVTFLSLFLDMRPKPGLTAYNMLG